MEVSSGKTVIPNQTGCSVEIFGVLVKTALRRLFMLLGACTQRRHHLVDRRGSAKTPKAQCDMLTQDGTDRETFETLMAACTNGRIAVIRIGMRDTALFA